MSGFAAAIQELLSFSPDEKQDLGEKARTRVAKNFELNQVVRLYEEVYQRLSASSERQNATDRI